MASLESEIGYILFRHREVGYCSQHQNVTTEVNSTYIRTVRDLQRVLQNQCNFRGVFYTRARFAAGRAATLLFPLRHCCHATSMGAATAIEE
jgi:hypothetical protein